MDILKGKRIVIGITGSIAAYKIPYLIRMFIREGAEVRIIMTPAATELVTPLTLSTLSKNPVTVELFHRETGEWSNHVELGAWADIMLFAPVTANTLGKMAHGIADNYLTTSYLSAKCPVFIAPAMDLDMYLHPSTQENLRILKNYGNRIIEPQTGELASGLSGPGRLEEPENIFSVIRNFFIKKESLKGKKLLITAGPTYEPIDPVRFLGNRSSGRMGFAIAEEAACRGADVCLISGPSDLQTCNPGITRINISTADEMLKSCIKEFPESDIVIMSAAVADYKIEKPEGRKIKKTSGNLKLELVPTPDILATLGKKKEKGQILVGFALETNDGIANARKKLSEKNLDLIVLNSLSDPGAGFGTLTNKVTLIPAKGKISEGELKSKREVASDILDFIEKIR
ncbi:MAG: bifunctional phosphopantothenoylcysteine decarboxylase/phosphopantothenate--cysteine ligase CoaBC [Bacteroidota bacterium]|nr:bifunctional phosphopantothenoylcysteine decarboxylase/phosphopantothenate--cysteine ligase CoaBC [Bacteroidota bacterium]